MGSVWNQEVSNYKVDVFVAPTLDYDRSIRLELANGNTVSLQFKSNPPNDYVDIGAAFHQIQLPTHQFDEMYHLLQTENPVYFTAYELGNPALRFAGLSTSEESVGEGLSDDDA